MSRLLIGLCAVAALFALIGSNREPRAAPQDDKVAPLEARAKRLEELVFATSKLSVYDAQRNLAVARSRLKETERLYLQGLLSEIQFQNDRFAVEQAWAELKLAQAESNGQAIAATIDLRAAEHELKLSEENLRFSERMAGMADGSSREVDSARAAVERARLQLDAAQKRLRAVQK
jgi:outer membrane protein TolC